MPNISEEQFAELKEEVTRLTGLVDALLTHKHLGNDSSSEFTGETDFVGRSLTIGGGVALGEKLFVPFQIVDATVNDALVSDKSSRAAAMGVLVTRKFQSDEQIHTMLAAIKNLPVDQLDIPLNKVDWTQFAESRLRIVGSPQGVAAFSGPSVFGPLCFLIGERTPSVNGTGTISLNGSLLTDSTADFPENSLVGALVNITDNDGNHVAGYKILSNTANVITMGQYKANGAVELASFPNTTGQYAYGIVTPALMGAAQNPYDRLYAGQDIRLGYGPSGGGDVRYIKWGNGSPEGVVTAKKGSLYLRFDGSAGTCFYVKESDSGATGWVAK